MARGYADRGRIIDCWMARYSLCASPAGAGARRGIGVQDEWAFIANWLIFAGLTLLSMDPFDLFGSDDDDKDDDAVDPNPADGIRIVGANEAEEIAGTEGDDILLGLAGDDRLMGGDGDDTLAGGCGTDDIQGGAGNDVLGVDRLDADAAWNRGGAETLSGSAGDDLLYFSGDDLATGGEGSDGFSMVISPDQGPGHVTDFVPTEDRLTFNTEFDPENPPEITVAADEDDQTTSVMIGARETLVLDGTFTRDELQIELKEAKDLALDHGPDLR